MSASASYPASTSFRLTPTSRMRHPGVHAIDHPQVRVAVQIAETVKRYRLSVPSRHDRKRAGAADKQQLTNVAHESRIRQVRGLCVAFRIDRGQTDGERVAPQGNAEHHSLPEPQPGARPGDVRDSHAMLK